MTEELKRQAAQAIDARREELIELSQRIHDHPELGFAEVQSATWLTDMCRAQGWTVKQSICGLDTAWEAWPDASKEGPSIGLLAEYDALPEIGHACGHNLMAVAPIAATIGLQRVLATLGGRVRIVGTPAEEGGGGKVLMGERGAFEGLDVAMMIHPSSHAVVRLVALACEHINVEFRGRPAHAAASPDKGVNALNAMLLSFNNIDALRQHIKSDARIHGVIRRGGDAANIVPDYTKATFMVRAKENVTSTS